MNLTLFTLVFGAQLVGLVIGSLFSSSTGVGSVSILAAIPNRSSFASTIIVLLRAIVDIVSISVLRGERGALIWLLNLPDYFAFQKHRPSSFAPSAYFLQLSSRPYHT